MVGHGWAVVPLEPGGGVLDGGAVDAEDGGVVEDEDGAVDEPGVTLEEGPGVAVEPGAVVGVAGVLVAAAETAALTPRPSPAAPPKMPTASRAFCNGVRMVEIAPF